MTDSQVQSIKKMLRDIDVKVGELGRMAGEIEGLHDRLDTLSLSVTRLNKIVSSSSIKQSKSTNNPTGSEQA
jgi:uncharacterized protein YoxC